MNTSKSCRANFIILFFLTLAWPFILNAQTGNKKKTVELLCHTWVTNFPKGTQKMDCFPEDADSTIRFLTNGYIIFNEKKGTEGVWNLDAVRNNLYILVYGNLWKYNINSISATELELAATGAGAKKNAVYYLLKSSQ